MPGRTVESLACPFAVRFARIGDVFLAMAAPPSLTMACTSRGESGDGNERKVAERAAVSVAPIAVSTSRRGPGMVMARRRLVLVGVRDEREQAGLL
mgnify:CR=1 FL=1